MLLWVMRLGDDTIKPGLLETWQVTFVVCKAGVRFIPIVILSKDSVAIPPHLHFVFSVSDPSVLT